MKSLQIACFLTTFVLCASPSSAVAQFSFTEFDHPNVGACSECGTAALGIDSQNIVGYYIDEANNARGFLYDGSTFTDINHPDAANDGDGLWGTYAYGIDGDKVVGVYYDAEGVRHGFIHDGTGFTDVDHPDAPTTMSNKGTFAYDIDGSIIVGGYTDGTSINQPLFGFRYDGGTFNTVLAPGSLSNDPPGHSTVVTGVDGDSIVGLYYRFVPAGAGEVHGFLFDGSSYSDIDHPDAGTSFSEGTYPYGIDGANVVGYYLDDSGVSHGFLLGDSGFIDIDHPNASEISGTAAFGISGNRVVGTYVDLSGQFHAFVTTIPEPSAMALFILACIPAAHFRL